MKPDLYQKTMDAIQKLSYEKSGAMIVVFAHGWKHNAASNDSNLIKFEEMLLSIHEDDKTICAGHSCEGRKIIGVFLAWRGLSAKIQPLKNLSFWNRKKRAHRVGQDGAIRVLARLDTIKTRSKAEGKKSRLVLIGHSFGAAIIYAGTQQRMVADLESPSKRGTVSRKIADLIILINPAFEAARFEGIHRGAASMNFPKGHKPILAVFTSKGDDATKKAFYIGRQLSTLFTKYNPHYPKQAKANKTALGHYEPFWTHRLEKTKQPRTYNSLQSAICDWRLFQHGDKNTWHSGSSILSRLPRMEDPKKEGGQVSNPYFVVSVSDEIIPDHNDIWRSEFVGMIYKLVAAQDPFRNWAKACSQEVK